MGFVRELGLADWLYCNSAGCGSKLNHKGATGFSPWFHLPGFHIRYLFLTHRQLENTAASLSDGSVRTTSLVGWMCLRVQPLASTSTCQTGKMPPNNVEKFESFAVFP